MYHIIRLLVLVAWLSSLSELTHSQCENQLNEETLKKLAISSFFAPDEFDLQPGQTFTFTLGAAEGCRSFEPVKACVVWTVEPAKWARIDAHTGTLTVDKATAHDNTFTVRAIVENGRRVVSTNVRVYTREANPLAGRWAQEMPAAGAGGETPRFYEQINELHFKADGTFSVTWVPFECYKDYWGTYTSDKETGRLKLTIDRGNHMPADVNGDGTFTLDGSGRLALKGICLGSPSEEAKGAGCDLVFKRRPY